MILVFLFLFTTIHVKCFCESLLLLNFQVPCERSSNIASFAEHPVFSILKKYSVLILLFLFCCATFYPKNFCKSHFFQKFQVLRRRSSIIASFVEHPGCSVLKMYSLFTLVFLFRFTTIHPKCFFKSHLFLRFQVLHVRNSVITSFVKQPVYSNFKMSVDSSFSIFIQHYSPKMLL